MSHTELYSVTATVIPVLVLAEALQRNLYRRMIQELSKPIEPVPPKHRRRPRWQRWIAYAMAGLMFVSATIGEATSVFALANNTDTLNDREWAVSSVLLLFLLVAFAVLLEIIFEIKKTGDRD